MRLTSSRFLIFALVLAACSAPPQKNAEEQVSADPSVEVRGLSGTVRQATPAGSANLQAGPAGVEGIQQPELRPNLADPDAGGGGVSLSSVRTLPEPLFNRSPFKGTRGGSAPAVEPTAISSGVSLMTQLGRPDPQLIRSFNGLNHRDQRLANGGNQFSLEPPDQGLCVGNGYVLESVNSALRIWRSDGTPATGVIDLNTFYGYPAAIDRSKPAGQPRFGPQMIDPVCLYDAATQRWFHVVFSLAVNPVTGALTGISKLEVAVSRTPDPTGAWTLYRIDTTADGQNCPCIPDYPHIGADAHGFYISVNNFPLFEDGFNGAFIYAFSKRGLARSDAVVPLVVFNPTDPSGLPGFTLWPAVSPDRDFEMSFGGTEYFLSSTAVFTDAGVDSRIVVWALTNTRTLDSRNPQLSLSAANVSVNPYGVPPLVDQKAGDFPLGQCINNTTAPTPFGLGCWRFFFVNEPAHNEVLSPLDANDSRMQQVFFADGKLWGALDTALSVGGSQKAGVAWYVLEPKVKKSGVTAELENQGYIGVINNHITYPALAVNKKGQGVMALTLVGPDHYPSAAYVGINAERGNGDVKVAAEGIGPQDGFTGYKAFGNPPRPRWGDYGAAAVDENGDIWIASEYIAQTCTLAQYMTAPFGSCGGTRTSLANWATRVSLIDP